MRYFLVVMGILLIAAGLVANFVVPLGASCANLTAWDLWRLKGLAGGCTGRRNGMIGGSAAVVVIGIILAVAGIVAVARRNRTKVAATVR